MRVLFEMVASGIRDYSFIDDVDFSDGPAVEASFLETVAQDIVGRLDQRPVYIPSATPSEITMRVVVAPSADHASPSDITDVYVLGESLFTDAQPIDALRFSTLLGAERDVELGAVIDIIAEFHLLPRSKLRLDPDLDLNALVRLPEYAGVAEI